MKNREIAQLLSETANHMEIAGEDGFRIRTTFAAELARWLVATRRFHRAAFCSVEQITERRQVLFSLGAQLVLNFATQAGTDDELGRQLLDRALREHPTLLVIDNMESLLDLDGLHEILDLCSKLPAKIIFTTREALPSPFSENILSIGRLDRQSAIRIVGNVLHKAPESSDRDEDIEKLVDAVDCHARSLVLIAREVGAAGVRHATENLLKIMKDLEAKHPGQRENSLLASAELSLRRLPPGTRELIRPLSVFHGGGGIYAIATALNLQPENVMALARALIGVGLAEYVEPHYLRFDPALIGTDLSTEHRTAAVASWASSIAEEIEFLYAQQFEDAVLANNLTVLELPNSLAALEHLATGESPERVLV
ncbi:MAG: hypothetical protein HY820_38575 [Acidobacteria bacterium]|nr:hypothetical protein [Acidobacteriota bacterium]